jgi:CheY-like chemotaxis protein
MHVFLRICTFARSGGAWGLNVPRILVVDDDASIRDSIKLVLETVGIETISAENGERALEAFSHTGCDGAIIDLMMPGMSGLETVCALREKSPELPIVVVSGSLTRGVAMPEMLRMATELKGVTGLAKPFKLAELLQAVRERFSAAPTLAPNPCG